MKRFFIMMMLTLLASCGFSQGDNVVVVPNDSPFRSQAWHGVFEKSDGDTSLINRDGKFVSVPSNEVFSSDDEKAKRIVQAREVFYKAFINNGKDLNKESVRDLLIEKAKDAALDDWVAFLALQPDIEEFNKVVAKSDIHVDDLKDAWEGLFEALSDLEEEVSHLTKPDIHGYSQLNFNQLVFNQLNQSVSDAISNTYVTSDEPNLDAWRKSLEDAFALVSMRVNEAKHQSLLIGKEMSEKGLDKVRVAISKKIIADTLPTSIKIGTVELGENTSSTTLLNFLVEKLPYSKQDLATFHGKKSWDELYAASQAIDKWASVLTSDQWKGEVVVHKAFGMDVHNNVELNVFYKDSLLKPVAKMFQSNGETLNGHVSQSKKGIQIKGDSANWNWQGKIDDDGALSLSGAYPVNLYQAYIVDVKLRSPIAIKKIEEARLAEEKRIEAERLAKIENLKALLKAHKWYGVPFNRNGMHWAANPVLITLDFNHNKFSIRDIGKKSEQVANTTFDFDVDEFGHGSLKDKALVETKNWKTGDSWSLTFSEQKNSLQLNIPSTWRNDGWKINFIPENEYFKRLNDLVTLAKSKWSSGDINGSGASSGRWSSTMVINQAKNIGDAVKLNGIYSIYGGVSTSVTYLAVPAGEKGAVLATLKLGKNNQQLNYGTSFAEDMSVDKLVFRDYLYRRGYVKISGAVASSSRESMTKVSDVRIDSPATHTKAVTKSASVSSPAHQVSHKPLKKVQRQHNLKKHSNELTKSDSKKLNQAIDSLKALL